MTGQRRRCGRRRRGHRVVVVVLVVIDRTELVLCSRTERRSQVRRFLELRNVCLESFQRRGEIVELLICEKILLLHFSGQVAELFGECSAVRSADAVEFPLVEVDRDSGVQNVEGHVVF